MRRERRTPAVRAMAVQIVLAVLQRQPALRKRRAAPEPDVHRGRGLARAVVEHERVVRGQRGRVRGLDAFERELPGRVGQAEEGLLGGRGGRGNGLVMDRGKPELGEEEAHAWAVFVYTQAAQ